MTYSVEFRKKVLSIKLQDHLSVEEVANRWGVGKSTVVRWSKRLEPQRTRHKPATRSYRTFMPHSTYHGIKSEALNLLGSDIPIDKVLNPLAALFLTNSTLNKKKPTTPRNTKTTHQLLHYCRTQHQLMIIEIL